VGSRSIEHGRQRSSYPDWRAMATHANIYNIVQSNRPTFLRRHALFAEEFALIADGGLAVAIY
jgi:hypothetical protein